MSHPYYCDCRGCRGTYSYENYECYDSVENFGAFESFEDMNSRGDCYNPWYPDFCGGNDDYIRLTHVHEVVGEVRLAERGRDAHNHHFAGVTDEVIHVPGGHIHVLHTKTDYFENHFHRIGIRTGPPVFVGHGSNARHVHYIDASTEYADGHAHKFIDATLIENPIGK